MKRPHFVIVTPVRNEQPHIEKMIVAVSRQQIRPHRWVIVDDGSEDATRRIIESHQKQRPWLELVVRPDRGRREPGSGVVAAFYDGYQRVAHQTWDYIVKLDGDLWFAPDYFRRLLECFAADADLGIGGGVVYNPSPTGPRLERQPSFHVRGATKMYSRRCWQAIGGLLEAPGWDTIDEVKANMLGFHTRSIAELHVYQQRVTGGAQGAWHNLVKNGRANYIAGYHPLFFLSKCLRRFFAPPFALGTLALLTGYTGARLRREARVADEQLVRYLQQQQLNRLLHRPSIWY